MKIRCLSFVPFLALALSGCGGSNSGSNNGGSFIADGSDYMGRLGDGTPMVLDFGDAPAGFIEGDFFMGTQTGQYANQFGNFRGTFDGTTFTASAETMDGNTFDLTGTRSGQNLILTRSDVPGEQITFALHAAAANASRATKTFTLYTSPNRSSASKGSFDDIAVQDFGWAQEYRGTMNGHKVTFLVQGTYVSMTVDLGYYGGHLSAGYNNCTIRDIGSKAIYSDLARARVTLREAGSGQTRDWEFAGEEWKLTLGNS